MIAHFFKNQYILSVHNFHEFLAVFFRAFSGKNLDVETITHLDVETSLRCCQVMPLRAIELVLPISFQE